MSVASKQEVSKRIFTIGCIIILVCLIDFVKADWIYRDERVLEGPMNARKVDVSCVSSDNNRTVSYDMTGDYRDEFEINQATGCIYQISPLDREIKPEYHITAIANDKGGNPSEEPVSFKIIVVDINDNTPIFEKNTLTGQVAEGHPTGLDSMPFMTIVAKDADENFNGEVVYSITQNSDTPPTDIGRFEINAKTGDVRVIGNLDYEANSVVRFVVKAEDGGGQPNRPTKSAIAEVVVTVTDSNDHAPEFQPVADRAFSEASPVNRTLYNLYATDKDEGVNKKVYFDIISGNIAGTFGITSNPSDSDNSIGQLYLRKPLDFESGTTTYLLSIRASNKEASNANEDSFYTTATLNITVLDANEPPIFRNTPYSRTVTEGPAPIEDAPIVEALAEDLDFNGNQTVSYTLGDPESWFRINERTGTVIHTGAIDREAPSVINGVYIIEVTATDNYDNGPPKSATETVEIIIKDVNDNSPMADWDKDGDNAFVCEKPVDEVVKVIKAKDPDSPANGPKFHFRFNDSVDTTLWKFQYVDDETENVVAKFSDYGLTTVTADFVDLVFTITDSGKPPQTGTATLTVKICKCHENGNPNCSGAYVAKFPIAVVVVAVILLLAICITVVLVVAYKRRRHVMGKQDEFHDESAGETVRLYSEECGECDNDTYDLKQLLSNPVIKIRRAKTCPNYDEIPLSDSLIVYEYEGCGSDAESLSSINTDTSDDVTDYDFLADWGPKFKVLSNIYTDHDGSDI